MLYPNHRIDTRTSLEAQPDSPDFSHAQTTCQTTQSIQMIATDTQAKN
jgi:hypothetical protein